MYAFLQINTYCVAVIRKKNNKSVSFIDVVQKCHVSENQCNQVIGMLQAGAMVNDVAQHFGYSRQTIHNLNTRFQITCSVFDQSRPGQRRHNRSTAILR